MPIVGVSLKMYFGHRQTLEWASRVADLIRRHPAVSSGRVEFFVAPSFPSLPAVLAAFAGTRALVAAQDVAAEDSGPYTGEVSAVELAEIGVRIAEVGHAERRRLFGDTDEVVAAKTAAALRNGLVPLICVGEGTRTAPDAALAESARQLTSALDGADAGRVIVAYEPVWAIGSTQPADPSHIAHVTRGLRELVDADPARQGSAVIYGGSAGPGLLGELGDAVDGLFLGRFAHDPAALERVLDEAAA
jgi:triosephosphate isomerase